MSIQLRYPDTRIIGNIASAGRFTPRERREAELRLWRSGLAIVIDPDQRAWLEAAIADTEAELAALDLPHRRRGGFRTAANDMS